MQAKTQLAATVVDLEVRSNFYRPKTSCDKYAKFLAMKYASIHFRQFH